MPLFRPIRTEILLSLRSFSSLFWRSFSFSASLCISFALFASLFWLSECKLRRELEPLSNDGRPKLRTDVFLCDELVTDGEDKLVGSLVGEPLVGVGVYFGLEPVDDW